MKIFDCFPFFNELDLLEIRLNILNDIVDYFVVCEAEHTHSNKYKGFILQQNKERFKKFSNKIRYIQIKKEHFNDMPWHNENLQRNSLQTGLNDILDNDICILSDLDEIPKPETVLNAINTKKIPCTLSTNLFYGYLNTVVKDLNLRNNNGSILFNKELLNRYKNLQNFRINKDNFENIPDGGWHFSFCVGNNTNKVIEKIQAFAHHKRYNDPNILKNIETNLNTDKDILSRTKNNFERVVDNSFLPEYIKQNLTKYNHLIKTSC